MPLRLERCAINTATLGFRTPIAATIESVSRAGFGGIGPWRREIEGEDVAAVARHMRDAGLAVTGYCRSTYLPAAGPAEFRGNIDDNRRAIDEAAVLGAECFVMVVGSLPRDSRDLADARMQVEEALIVLLDHARRAGVRLALEPLHPVYAADRSCLNTIEQALDLADRIDPDAGGRLGLAIDVYHVWWDPKLAGQVARAGRRSRIAAFHVSDWLLSTRDVLLDRGMMGDGVVDIPSIRALVEAAGYRGMTEVEIFSERDWWRRDPSETLAVCAERLLAAC